MGLVVTDRQPHYHGSQTLPRDVMAAAGIEPYEQVHVVNIRNGARWITYAIEGNETEVVLNGAAARMGEVGDELIIMAYRQSEEFKGATVIFCDYNANAESKRLTYEPRHP
jgi:aspartate 1-decarboxylase